MLNSLTKEQEALMTTVRNEWLDKIFDPDKRLKLNKEEAKEKILWMYKLSNLKKPKHIIFLESPLGLQMAIWLLESLKKKCKSVESSVWSSVGSSVRSLVWSSVGSSVRSSVGSSVGSSVWSSVGSSVRSKFTPFTSYGSIADYGWCSFYDFFKRIGIVKDGNFDCFLNLLHSGIYDMILLESFALVCPMPSMIKRMDVRGEMRLHSIDGFAIEWPDGYGQNYLWGVFFPDIIWKKIMKKNMSLKTVLSIENTEQRMAALKFIGSEKLLESANAELINKSERGNMLYKIEKIFPQTAYFLKYLCPSTGRVYVSGIDPEIGKKGDADYAMAWKFGLDLPSYQSLLIES